MGVLEKRKTNEIINNKIKELKNDKQIINYINKINFSKKFNVIEECCICYETKLNITFECSHYVCINCYNELNKCPLCRK